MYIYIWINKIVPCRMLVYNTWKNYYRSNRGEREFPRARIPPSTCLSSDFKIQGVAVAASCKFPNRLKIFFSMEMEKISIPTSIYLSVYDRYYTVRVFAKPSRLSGRLSEFRNKCYVVLKFFFFLSFLCREYLILLVIIR